MDLRLPARSLEFALLPPRCGLCGLASDRFRDLCGSCAAALVPPPGACPRCGDPVPPRAVAWPCGRCQRRPPPWEAFAARCRWGPDAAALVHDLKFRGHTACARIIAELMVEHPPAFLDAEPTLVPVPLHWRRRWARGFDQAALLAAHLSRITGLPRLDGGLRRHRATAPQSSLSAVRRRRGPRDAFAPGAHALPATVVLVDDVSTTGATLAAAARACRTGGARTLYAWVFAHSPRR